VENQISKKMKMLWYNHGGGFTSRDFNAFCELYGITCQLTNSYSPQQNWISKWKKQP
jgi:transposase InsO family protein